MRECVIKRGIVSLGLGLALVPVAARGQGQTARIDDEVSAKTPAEQKMSLRMSPGIVCRSIDGYEDYKVLRKATQTSDEKLLVYFRPLGFQTELIEGAYQAHLITDFQIRKRGEKAILLQKQKMYEYKPRTELPPRRLYMKNAISLKGLAPGDYDLTLILHDEIAKGTPAKQVVRFRIIRADLPPAQPKESRPIDRPTNP